MAVELLGLKVIKEPREPQDISPAKPAANKVLNSNQGINPAETQQQDSKALAIGHPVIEVRVLGRVKSQPANLLR